MLAVQNKKRKAAFTEDDDDECRATRDKPTTPTSPHRIPSVISTTSTKALQPLNATYPSTKHYFGRRKPICEACWRNSIFCDFGGQCKACRDRGVQCVRVKCERGSLCENPRCPCLHDGEWDKSDRDWIVVEGQMPRKRMDSYRPGH